MRCGRGGHAHLQHLVAGPAAKRKAAALATLTVADRDQLIPHPERMGSRFRQGIAEHAAAHGVTVRQSGPAQLPLILFDDDPNFERGIAFTAAAPRLR